MAAPKAPSKTAVAAQGPRFPWLFVISTSLALLWLGLSPPFYKPSNLASRSKKQLQALFEVSQNYLKEHREAPPSLAELRAYALLADQRPSTHDAYGQRFDLLRLDTNHFILRSFGSDGVQNHLQSPPDIVQARLGSVGGEAPRSRYAIGFAPGFYPAVLLSAADAPNRKAVAKLYVDAKQGLRTLVVKQRDKPGMIMTAPHDGVEEFLWLPGGERLVYTATESSRHRDGVYLWSLESDAIINLMDTARGQLPLAPHAKDKGTYFLSLAGISAMDQEQKSTIRVWFAPRGDEALDPRVFFSQNSLLSFAVDQHGLARFVPQARAAPSLVSPLDKPLDLKAGIDIDGADRDQQQWLGLPSTGDMEQVLLRWHAYADSAAEVRYPYALWLLTTLYNQCFAKLRHDGLKDAEIIRAYGTEVARALLQEHLAPAYLRGMSSHLYGSLMAGEPVLSNIANLLPPDVAFAIKKVKSAASQPKEAADSKDGSAPEGKPSPPQE